MKSTHPQGFAEPIPSSLCPQCGRVETESRQRTIPDGREEIYYADAEGHEWWVRWDADQEGCHGPMNPGEYCIDCGAVARDV